MNIYTSPEGPPVKWQPVRVAFREYEAEPQQESHQHIAKETTVSAKLGATLADSINDQQLIYGADVRSRCTEQMYGADVLGDRAV